LRPYRLAAGKFPVDGMMLFKKIGQPDRENKFLQKIFFGVTFWGNNFNPDNQMPLLVKLFGLASVVISTLREYNKVSKSIKNPLNQRVFCCPATW
jgi:hypothetical protein